MRTAVPGLVHLPAEPRAGHRRHGPVRCSEHWLRPALCPCHRSAGPPRPCLDHVTTHPTAEWIARQITEAFPWNEAPRYLIRDRDRVYGVAVMHRLRAIGIRDKPIAPGSPWQNGFAERLIGAIRRECVDHVVVLGEAHLRRILTKYAAYYNELRTHRSLNKGRSDTSRHPVRGRHCICARPRRTSSPLLQNLIFGTDRPIPQEMSASRMIAARVTPGAICLSNSSHLPLRPYSNERKPVTLPPGRARLAMRPAPTGSGTIANTIGTVRVIWRNGAALAEPGARIASGASDTNSAAY